MKILFKDNDRVVSYDDSKENIKEMIDFLFEEYFIPNEGFTGEIICQDDDCQIEAISTLANFADKFLKVEYND